MKLKSVFFTAAIALTLSGSAVQAAFVGSTTNFSRLSVTLNVYTNAPTLTNSTSEYNKIGKAKIGNAQLIQAFAGWNGVDYTNSTGKASDTNWNGAMLIYDWQTEQACVADRTGTNILFYAGDGITSGGTNASFTVEWIQTSLFDGEGPFARTRTATSDKYTEFNRGSVEFIYQVGGENTDLWGTGAEVDHFAQFYDSLANPTYWTDSQTFRPANADKNVLLHSQQFCAVDGTVTAIGKRAGTNPVLTP